MRERRRVGRLEQVNRGDIGALPGTDRDRGISDSRLAGAPRPRQHDIGPAQQRHRDPVDVVLAPDHLRSGNRVVSREQGGTTHPSCITHNVRSYLRSRDAMW